MSEITEQLKQLTTCGKAWAERRAQLAIRIQTQREAGAISESEAAELLNDLIRTDKLDREADDVQTKALIIKAISALSKLA
jgi:hypothetical protein